MGPYFHGTFCFVGHAIRFHRPVSQTHQQGVTDQFLLLPDLCPPPDMLKEVLAHRGPDRFGYTQVGSCTLWHYRLSVIDPSDQGNQPLTTPCGRYTLIFNGEVYNYRALKKQFNLHCVGKSDSEVVLLLFKALGTESIALLEGMFSFAIWDAQENELTLARDRIGIKPLYYSLSHSGDFVFSSEIKGIQSLAPRKPSDEHLSDYLSLGFVPGHNTLFEGVYQVKPGSYVQVKRMTFIITHSTRYLIESKKHQRHPKVMKLQKSLCGSSSIKASRIAWWPMCR